MSNKDKVMDKYWLEFIGDNQGDISTWRQVEAAFWYWFYNKKMANGNHKLEDFLK